MRRGDYAAAWAVSDRVLQERIARDEPCHDWPRHLQYIWRGEPLDDRRVLVRCYHGLGDTLQFVRLLALARQRAREVVLWVQPALIEILRSVTGIDRLLPLHAGAPDVEYDVDVELMELCHVLRVTPETLSAPGPLSRVPYIYVSPAAPRPPSDARLQVGMAWRSGDWNPDRSIPDELLAKLRAVPGVRWHSLQYPLVPPPIPANIMACREIHVMAARMQSLDLVISVDSMPAHLAGALGLQVWTLLHEQCDWRWMSCGERTPWYPTMRLFRQPRAGDWESVLAHVRHALASERHCARERRPARMFRRSEEGSHK
jgi:hypothetical protein